MLGSGGKHKLDRDEKEDKSETEKRQKRLCCDSKPRQFHVVVQQVHFGDTWFEFAHTSMRDCPVRFSWRDKDRLNKDEFQRYLDDYIPFTQGLDKVPSESKLDHVFGWKEIDDLIKQGYVTSEQAEKAIKFIQWFAQKQNPFPDVTQKIGYIAHADHYHVKQCIAAALSHTFLSD